MMKYVDTHHLNLSHKAAEIVEHFRTHCQPKIGGKAAMMVASSRLQALKYQARNRHVHHIHKIILESKPLLHFTGSIRDNDGNIFTEQNVNKTTTSGSYVKSSTQQSTNILVVAEKYQTGYDQPLLHTL